MVKRLRHRPFTAVSGVQIPLESRNSRILLLLGHTRPYADVAQLAEQLICNQQVIGSSPIIGFYCIFGIQIYGPLAQLVRAIGS